MVLFWLVQLLCDACVEAVEVSAEGQRHKTMEKMHASMLHSYQS